MVKNLQKTPIQTNTWVLGMVPLNPDHLSSIMEGASLEDGVVSFKGKAIKMDKGEDGEWIYLFIVILFHLQHNEQQQD